MIAWSGFYPEPPSSTYTFVSYANYADSWFICPARERVSGREEKRIAAREREAEKISHSESQCGKREARRLTLLPINRRQPKIAEWLERDFGMKEVGSIWALSSITTHLGPKGRSPMRALRVSPLLDKKRSNFKPTRKPIRRNEAMRTPETQAVCNEVAKALREEAMACIESSNRNPSPQAEIFHIVSHILSRIAEDLRRE